MSSLFRVEILGLLIPIVAIIVGGVVVVTKVFLRHQERMSMIERGMHPDGHASAEDEDYRTR